MRIAIINYKLGNTTGGLVDGPVYDTIFGSLLGISTEGARTDKFYARLPELIRTLKRRGYEFVPLSEACR